jgi:hypothetical protein
MKTMNVAIAEAKRDLFIVGEHRLGVPDPHSRTVLGRIQEIEHLEEMMSGLSDAASWQELLEQAAPRRRNGRRRPASS